MVKVVRFHETGGPDVLQYEDIDLDPPGPGEAQIRNAAIGLNFIDCYFRSGLYPVDAFANRGGGGRMPFVPGVEGAGIVEAVGDQVESVAVGDRVAYGLPPPGAYAEVRNFRADRLVKLPDSIDDHTAAAMMLKDLTVHMLLRRTYDVKPGDYILFHAAAGGVGVPDSCRGVHYIATPADLQEAAAALIDVIQSGAVKIEVNQTFALADAAEAHRALEARATTGSTILVP